MDVAALLAHPLATFGLTREHVARLAPLVEIAVLRVVADGSASWAARADGARALAADAHAFPAAKRLGGDDWRAIQDLLARLDDALRPMTTPREALLDARVRALRVTLEAVTASHEECEAMASAGMEEFLALLDQLENAEAPIGFDARELRDLSRRLAVRDQGSRAAPRPSAPEDFGAARSTAHRRRSCVARGPRRRRWLTANGRRRLSQSLDARRAQPVAAGATHRPKRA